MGCNYIRSRRAEEPRILEKQIPTRGILDNTITQSSIVIFCIRYLNNRRDFIIIFSVSWIIFFSSYIYRKYMLKSSLFSTPENFLAPIL